MIEEWILNLIEVSKPYPSNDEEGFEGIFNI